MRRVATLLTVAVLFLTAGANAQPIVGSGCPPGAPLITGPFVVKSGTVATWTCPPTLVPGVMVLSVPGPLLALPTIPPACLLPCVIACFPPIAFLPSPLTVALPPAPGGFIFCLQCIYLFPLAPPCLVFSEGITVTVVPC